MAIRLVAVDLDGTLLTAKQEIPARVRQAVAQAAARGIEVVISTGRSPVECGFVLEALPQVRYVIACTGAAVMDVHTGAVMCSCALSADDARVIYDHLRRFDGMISFFADGAVYNARWQMEEFERYYPEDRKPLFVEKHVIVDDLDEMIRRRETPVEKFYVSFADRENCLRAREDFSHLPYFATGAGFDDLDIMHPEASKGKALRQIAELLGLRREEVMAIGDSGNDEAMLRYAGTGVAMENGDPALKAIADHIAPSNEDGGVGYMIEKIIQGEI